MDVNQAVNSVCDEIRQIDGKFIKDVYSSFNIAFLDPEGLELTWETVEKLGSMSKMDLIINFSTGGLNRTRIRTPELGDAFFGTDEWRRIVNDEANATQKRRAWIDLYVRRLGELGYTFQADDEGEAEIVAKNSKNVQVYSIIFASKNKLGLKLWREAVNRARHPRLFD
jgi:three-Cys-motif partner protein